MSASLACSSAEDDFMRVLDEMNTICGEAQVHESVITSPGHEDSTKMAEEFDYDVCGQSSKSLVGDQLLSAAASASSGVGAKRSRHGSANSAKSCVSFDSAIGDVYSSSTLSPTTCQKSQSRASASAGLQFEALAASVCLDDDDLVVGPNAPLVGSEDLVGEEVPMFKAERVHKRPSRGQQPSAKRARAAAARSQPRLTPQMVQHRQEVEMICLDLVNRFHKSGMAQPRAGESRMSAWAGEDPLLITTKLLGDSLSRLRAFLFGLDPMNWLVWPDRNLLYNANLCALAVFKASVSVNLEAVPVAFPLPYGEFLGEVEALHLILAHDLYNELRSLLSHIQGLGVREFPAMLLLMMIALFSPQPGLRQPEKVVRIRDYYLHKMQIYLTLRFGPDTMMSLMTSLMSTIEKVRQYCAKLREFLCDVTRCGLQKQFESVCENIGLIAFLLQTEPRREQ